MQTTHNDRITQLKEEKQRAQLITVDRKYSLLNKDTKRQVESHLESNHTVT
jgi:hypothetical protein